MTDKGTREAPLGMTGRDTSPQRGLRALAWGQGAVYFGGRTGTQPTAGQQGSGATGSVLLGMSTVDALEAPGRTQTRLPKS